MDDAACAEGRIPEIDAENKVQFFTKALEIGRVFVESFPNTSGENLGVIILVKESFKEFEELGDDAMRALGLPEFGVAGKFVLSEAVLHQPEIFNRAGEDEFVDEQDDGLGGLLHRGPLDLVEFVEPDFKVFKELLFEFRLVRRVFQAAQSIQHAAGFPTPV